MATLKDATKPSTDEEIQQLVDFLEKKIDYLPEELVSFEEPLIEAKSIILPEEKDPETQGANETIISDPTETIENELSKSPHLKLIHNTAIVHSKSPPSPIDAEAVNYLDKGTISEVIAPEKLINPETNEASHNVRALRVEEPKVVSFQRLGYKPIPLTDVFSSSE
jgi:hypothetical protein